MNDFFLFFTIIILTLAGALAIEFGARELLRITNKKRNRSTVDDRMVHSVMNVQFETGFGAINTFKLPTTMKLTTFEQAVEHYRMGYYSLITNGDSYCVLSFPQKHSAKTFLRSSYWTKENEALEAHEITAQTFGENTINQWRMVRAIHPSHYMGEGIKEGDKVVVKDLGEPRTAYTVQNVDNNNSSFRPIGFAGSHYNPEELLPAPFEKQDSQDVLDAIELLKREGKIVDGKILNLS